MFNTKTSLALASATKEQEKAEEDALLSEPHHTTLWKPLGDRNYRKRELYDLNWEVDLSKHVVTGAPCGGALAVSRDERKIVLLSNTDSLKSQTHIYTSSGVLIKSFAWDSQKGRVVRLGWTADEKLVCIFESGAVMIYNVQGENVSAWSVGPECGEIQDALFWGTGFVVLSKALRLFAVMNLADPKIRPLPDARLESAPVTWCVIGPDVSLSKGVEVLLATATGTVLLVTHEHVKDLLLQNGPFVRMTVSRNGKLIACFTEAGTLWVVSADFSKSLSEFSTGSKVPPSQVEWCGADSVVMYWPTVGLLMVGPNGHWIKYSYAEPGLSLLPDPDGLRIFSATKCEFLQKVPAAVEDVFKIGSEAPSALLYDALAHYKRGSPRAYENVKMIKAELVEAVDGCIEAAGHEFSPALQRRLLEAAEFGKGFAEGFRAERLVEMCKALHVINNVRQSDIGMPLTFLQYDMLGPEALIERLVNRHLHPLADAIAGFLKLKRDSILIHWASRKVRTEAPEREILEQVVSKLAGVPGVPYADIASAAYKARRPDLATRLLEYEPRASAQVPLLLHMGEDENALSKALDSGDTDLVYLVLLHIRRSRSGADFFKIIRSRKGAVDLLVAYCKQQDLDLLKDIYYQAGMPNQSAHVAVIEAYQHAELEKRVRGLQIALNLYKDTGDLFASKATETEIRLLLVQKELESETGERDFVGGSLTDTLFRLIASRNLKRAQKIKSDFKVPDKRFWWVAVRALSTARDWATLEQFAKSKKSPIGFRPFAEMCIEQGAMDEAAKYIAMLSDSAERVQMFLLVNAIREAAQVAFEQKDVQLLQSILPKATTRQDQALVMEMLAKLGVSVERL